MIRSYRRVLTMIATSMFLVTLAGCGGGDSGPTSSPAPEPPTPAPPPPTPVATSLTITPSSHTLTMIGATVRLSAMVRDQNNNPMTGPLDITWTSSNPAVAPVTSGLVTAVANGTAQITARLGNASGTASITVAEPVPTRVTISPTPHTLEAIGATVQLSATVRDQRNNVMSGQPITWSSGDEAVATVSGDGLVTAVGNGMTEITAKSGNPSGTASITVAQAPAAIVIEVDAEATTLTEIDQTLQLMASVSDANDHPIADPDITWSSSDESVATVDEDGLVTAVSNGMADITATSGDVSQRVIITVMTPSPDRETLIAIYNATDGPNWTQQDNWLSETHISTWYGITTNDVGRVTRIELAGVGMAGPIPVELAELAHLDSLDIFANVLTGSIPAELSQLDRLVYLDLKGNDLTGSIPAELGQLTGLKEMYLGVNRLSGPIPPELGQMSSLETLNITHGYLLSGPIPPELGQLTNLVNLTLDQNELSGVIPAELGQLTSLQSLSLSNNELEGAVPEEIGDLPRLQILKLDHNEDLSGELPLSFVDSPVNDLRLEGTDICVPPLAEFRAWVNGLEKTLGVAYCEVEYTPWEGVRVNDSGHLVFRVTEPLPINLAITGCLTEHPLISGAAPFPPEGVKDWYNDQTMDTLTIHYSVWQWSDDMGGTWRDVEDTRVMYDACAYNGPNVASEYRLVGDITLNGEREFRKTENTFTVEP